MVGDQWNGDLGEINEMLSHIGYSVLQTLHHYICEDWAHKYFIAFILHLSQFTLEYDHSDYSQQLYLHCVILFLNSQVQ